MYIKVKTMDGKQSSVLAVSKMMKIEELRKLVFEKMEVEPAKQRLFFRGKQLEDEYSLLDYSINLNDVIQLLVRSEPLPSAAATSLNNNCSDPEENEKTPADNEEKKTTVNNRGDKPEEGSEAKSEYYEVGDLVDAKDPFTSSWIEAKIVKIKKPPGERADLQHLAEALLYHVLFEGHVLEDPTIRNFSQVRPRAWNLIPPDNITVGDVLMVNYNLEDRKERGLWYDARITKVAAASRTGKKIIATIIMGEANDMEVNDCDIYFIKEILAIPSAVKISERTEQEERLMKQGPAEKRVSIPYCQNCNDNPRRKCKFCGCNECGSKENPNQQVMCDECDRPYHVYCLKPPMEAVPDDEWYCPHCKTDDSKIVKAGEKLKESKKNAKRPSKVNTSTRDWGRGMACAGRNKECTIVPSNHFGPIPGVDVGTVWRYRFQASEAGVHRPPVGGIHGREKEGAYSIVLSGGYEDDEDFGDSFYYTGSGGRDLTGNKRTAEQSCDQTLTRMNMALALNCAAPLNDKEGAEAKDWQKGKPVRVLRKGQGDEKSLKPKKPGKHSSKYSPDIGVRYDGIYKVVKYWPEKGKSGFVVWRYFLKRDDPIPPVWTAEGKKRIEQLGLDQVLYPEGHLEAQEALAQEKANSKAGKKTLKDFLQDGDFESPAKKMKKAGYQLEPEIDKLINADELNAKMWEECKVELGDTKQKFLSKVEERFLCICCQDIVCRPVTTPCKHNICIACLSRAFKAEVYKCPCCRYELNKTYQMTVNEQLAAALNALFPGYEGGR